MAGPLEDQLKSLNDKFKNDHATFNLVDMEKCLREVKTELYIKRDQVKQLWKELELASAEVVQLKRNLDSATKLLEEKTFNLNVFTKKFRSTEDELLEKIETLSNIQLQNKLTIAEVEKLKQNLQENESEKLELSRKVEILETKQKQTHIYQNILVKRETKLKSNIEELEEMVKKVNLELSEITELSNKNKLAEESIEKCQRLTQNYEKLKQERDHFEELYTKVNAKYEMLEQLLELNDDIQTPDLITTTIFNQWKDALVQHENDLKNREHILNKVTNCYNQEKITNSQLIAINCELQIQIEALNKKIDKLRVTHKNETEKTQIKEEPIFIED